MRMPRIIAPPMLASSTPLPLAACSTPRLPSAVRRGIASTCVGEGRDAALWPDLPVESNTAAATAVLIFLLLPAIPGCARIVPTSRFAPPPCSAATAQRRGFDVPWAARLTPYMMAVHYARPSAPPAAWGRTRRWQSWSWLGLRFRNHCGTHTKTPEEEQPGRRGWGRGGEEARRGGEEGEGRAFPHA